MNFKRHMQGNVVISVVCVLLVLLVCAYWYAQKPLQVLKVIRTIQRKKCQEENVTLSFTYLPITALASYPGSGNTWTRHLIQQLTGIATSSVYCDPGLKANGFQYECVVERNRTILTKTHETNITKARFDRVVILIRNPYESSLSFYQYVRTASQMDIANTSHLQLDAVYWKSHFKVVLRGWVEFYRKWLKFPGEVHVLQYDHLVSDLSNTLLDLTQFLGVPVTMTDLLCTVELQEGNHHRKYADMERENLIRKMHDDDMIKKMNSVIYDLEVSLKNRFNKDFHLAGRLQQSGR